jgi:hypothetical protein
MGETTPFLGTRATTQRQEQSRKRGPSSPIQTIRSGKEPTPLTSRLASNTSFAPPTDLNNLFGPTRTPGVAQIQAKEALLQARDLILKASLLVKDRDEQSRILDLLGIFREYIEKGTILKTSAILASQVANLERATRKVETLAKPKPATPIIAPSNTSNTRTLQNQPSVPSFAQLAQKLSTKETSNDWTLVDTKEKARARLAESQKKKESAKTQEKNRRLVLLSTTISEASFSALRLRNLFNSAF